MLAISSSANLMRASFQEPTVARLRQAAERAQQVADNLQTQAQDAWQEVEQAATQARGLDSRANQATADAGQAQERFIAFTSRFADAPATSTVQSSAPTATTGSTTSSAPMSSADTSVTRPIQTWSPTPAPAGVNSLGQRVGAFLNITA